MMTTPIASRRAVTLAVAANALSVAAAVWLLQYERFRGSRPNEDGVVVIPGSRPGEEIWITHVVPVEPWWADPAALLVLLSGITIAIFLLGSSQRPTRAARTRARASA
jgi:hypothetical protein